MKRKHFYIWLVAAMLTGGALMSCGDDDNKKDEPNNQENTENNKNPENNQQNPENNQGQTNVPPTRRCKRRLARFPQMPFCLPMPRIQRRF
ncbi:MAG: hypothetical protein IJ894_07505 [Bacteroidales bacterium]|nr:hypothetical protein [Bacteroidales bacterium]